jgi:hypothetical protein
MRQDPAECLLSFIVSSNNNISRIALILNRLRKAYGTHLLTLPPPAMPSNEADAATSVMGATRRGGLFGTDESDDEDDEDQALAAVWSPEPPKRQGAKASSPRPSPANKKRAATQSAGAAAGEQAFYSFPSLSALAGASDQELRGLGLGYRARFVRETATALLAKGLVKSAGQPSPLGDGSASLLSLALVKQEAADADEKMDGGEHSHGNDGLSAADVVKREYAAASACPLVGADAAKVEEWDPVASAPSFCGGASSESGARAWLAGLRDHGRFSRQDVQRELMAFTGVGQKVASWCSCASGRVCG